MRSLSRSRRVVQLAQDLGLSTAGDCLKTVKHYALERVEGLIEGVPISNLDDLCRVLANKLSVKFEFVRCDDDIERLAQKHADFNAFLANRLTLEFRKSDTEGILLKRPDGDPAFLRYLAFIDARGERASRAYFTAWHEIAHLLLHPPQLQLPEFRRTPTPRLKSKDPLESAVDHIAGSVAFYRPLFEPALRACVEAYGGLSFRSIEAARNEVAPGASLYASAIQSIDYSPQPILLVGVDEGLNAAERRLIAQPAFNFAESIVRPALRVQSVIPNQIAAHKRTFEIRRNMRVPADSVLTDAYAAEEETNVAAREDQAWWETSTSGHLSPLPVDVHAARRGRYVYGIIIKSN